VAVSVVDELAPRYVRRVAACACAELRFNLGEKLFYDGKPEGLCPAKVAL